MQCDGGILHPTLLDGECAMILVILLITNLYSECDTTRGECSQPLLDI